MAWEKRADKPYYYRSVRRGRQVVKEYFGGDVCGLLAADLQAERTARRQARRDLERALESQLEAVDCQLDQLENLVKSLTAATLYSRGYYRHGREWRTRKRWPKSTP